MSGFVRVVVAGAVWVNGVYGAKADPLTMSQATSTHLVGLNEWTRDGGHVVGQIFTAPDAVHTVLTAFLTALGVDAETAAEDACRIEHVLSEETFDKLKQHAKAYIDAQGK